MSHISYSELKEWTTCAWKHKLNYIEKIKLIKVIKFLKRYKKNLLSKKQTFNFNEIKKKNYYYGCK